MTKYTKNNDTALVRTFKKDGKNFNLKTVARPLTGNLPKKITKPKITPALVKTVPIGDITKKDLMRKNHEAFHEEKDDYKITYRYEYIDDVGKVQKILGNNHTPRARYGEDKVGMVYRTCMYYNKVASLKNNKGYKYERMPVRYAQAYEIYQPPEFISVNQALKEINAFRNNVNPFRRMTAKYI